MEDNYATLKIAGGAELTLSLTDYTNIVEILEAYDEEHHDDDAFRLADKLRELM